MQIYLRERTQTPLSQHLHNYLTGPVKVEGFAFSDLHQQQDVIKSSFDLFMYTDTILLSETNFGGCHRANQQNMDHLDDMIIDG